MLAPLARSWRLAMFDRDSTNNVDTGHLHEPEKLELIPSTVDIMRCYFEDPDYKLVVTNQADIAKGLYTKADMRNLHRCMEDELEKLGVFMWTPGTFVRTIPTILARAYAASLRRGCCWLRCAILSANIYDRYKFEEAESCDITIKDDEDLDRVFNQLLKSEKLVYICNRLMNEASETV